MKKLVFVAIVTVWFIDSMNVVRASLVINEFMASNRSSLQDPQGQFDDWIEIYNNDIEPVSVGGMYLTDDFLVPTKWRFPSDNLAATTIPDRGYLLVWADNDTDDPGLHVNFQLDADGEEIGLFDIDGTTLIDSVVFGEQASDISYGRSTDAGEDWQFFAYPSPGVENIAIYDGFVGPVEFSQERGFYDTPFVLTLATETEDAVIYYSRNGNDPFKMGPRGPIGGTIYTAPISISGTTCLRAVAIKEGWKPSTITTHTFIFVNDVIRQSSTGQPPSVDWPSGSINGQTMNYGMDPDVFNDPRYRDLMDDALLAIPSISLVTEPANLFDQATGIYVNARRYGKAWERPVSVELINPDDSEGFQIDGGLRIRGGYSRSGSNPKHAFRLFFRAEYGQPKLVFPLFGDEGVDEFDNVDLRTSQNYSWSYDGSDMNTMVREVFSRDTQRDMSQPYTRSRYYHLYLNGQYWGIYQTQERSEASYAESYLGGNKDDYDVVKTTGGNPNYTIEATDGSIDAYRRLWEAARAGFYSDADYYRIQGMNPDGTRNPDYERLVDVDNLIDYMLCTFYVGDCDGPISNFLGNSRPNNYYSIYNRVNPDGFKFFRHDGEHTLGVRNWCYDRTGLYSAGRQFADFNPQWLHQQLAVHPEYRVRMGDRAHKYFFNNGVLTPGQSTSRLMERARQIETAIIAESARWGDSKRSNPFTRDDHWWPEINRIVNDYDGYGFPTRTQVLIGQLQSKGWYPNVDAPVFYINGNYQHGGVVFKNDVLTIQAPSGAIWYTLDDSDPRSRGTGDQGADMMILAPENADKRVLVPIGIIDNGWKGVGAFDDSAWLYCIGDPGGVGFERTSGYESFISLDLQDQMYARNATCYIRIPFTVDDGDMSKFTSMTLKAKYDDGFVAYLNGIEVARRNFNGVPTWNSRASSSHSDSLASQFESIDISESFSLLRQGNNLLAIQGMNSSTTSGDFLISAELVAGTLPDASEYTGPITLDHSTKVKARVLSNDTWSALNEAIYAVGPVSENLRITEIMYHPQALTDAGEPNEEFIELTNIGADTINLNLVHFANGINFTFPVLDLAPGQYVVIVQDRDAFESRYGTDINIAGQYSGRLNNAGERITLADAIGRTILDFRYNDGWRTLTDGEGFSLTIIDPANPDLNSWDLKDSWRSSAYPGGSPGQDDSGILPDPGAVVFNEVLAHSHAGDADWIELHNTTRDTINISGWFLSDSNDNLFKYEIAPGTTIGSGDYLLLREDVHFGNMNDPGCHEPFALSENGETLYLSSAQNGLLTGYREIEDFGASETDISFGRYFKTSTGNTNFVAMEIPTPGSENAYPLVGPIVISEIMYNPDWPVGGSYTNDQYEYIELSNVSSEPVTLYDDDKSEPWKFTSGIQFMFSADLPVTIPAGGYLVVARHPEAFLLRYPDIPVEMVFGPYEGQLSNAGESVELSKPGDIDNAGVRHYIRVDRVNYSDGSHPDNCPGFVDLWPNEADGNGMTLTHKVLNDYGNDPDNWIADIPSPGE